MIQTLNYYDFVPQIVPQNMNGKISYRICIKKDHVRSDGTCALYINIYYEKRQKRLPLNISVPSVYFDQKKRRVKPKYKYANDYNLLIEKVLGDLNSIEIGYRLNETDITLERIVEDFLNPSSRINFISFAEKRLKFELEKEYIKKETHRQQKAFIEKLKSYKNPLLFSDIDEALIIDFRVWLRTVKKNSKPTIEGTLKNFKKYLHLANKAGIKTKINYTDIKVGSMKGNFTFLLPEEVKNLYEFYKSPFINESWKHILQRYLFSCFTGLRISDIEAIGPDNFVGDFLVWNAKKTETFNRIIINKTAASLIEMPKVFNGNFTREYINRELKEIAKACDIKKRLYFHSARHTFATNYLIAGGQLQNLKKVLGHSKIETTMIYSHAVETLTNREVELMDGIVY